jgi:DNA (cytosine-5)-methyltransferase 1
MLNGLDLFSGIGGFALALAPWVRTVAYCEIDRHAQSVLLERMHAGELDAAPIWDNVQDLRGDMLPPVDLIYGGFPCQDLSVAGARVGLAGERSGLFFEIVRLIRECRPSFVMLENVPNVTVLGLDRVLLEFDALGFDARWTVVSAEEVGAPFLGERWFCLAMAKTLSVGRGEGWPELLQLWGAENVGDSGPLGSPNGARLERAELTRKTWAALAKHRHSSRRDWPSWLPEPALPRGHDGLRLRMERIRESGNAVVWLQAEEAFKRLGGLE